MAKAMIHLVAAVSSSWSSMRKNRTALLNGSCVSAPSSAASAPPTPAS